MNLLPFVMIIIMVLTLFSLSQFEGVLTQKKENQVYLAYFRGLREIRNEKAKAAYKKTLTKSAGEKKTPKGDKVQKNLEPYFREKRVGWKKGRLNLSTLLKKPHKYPSLEAVAVKYIRQLYGEQEFFPKNNQIIKDLLNTLINEYQKDPSISMHQIILKDCQLQKIFYKMMKGTHTYDLKQKGYPPFGEMFTFEKNGHAPMNYHYANIAFLAILFGENITQEFVKLEKSELIHATKKSESPIKKSEFDHLVQEQILDDQNNLLELFDFTYQASERTPEKYQDATTQITVKVQ